MATPSHSHSTTAPSDHLRFLLTLVLTVAILYLGKSIIIPLALAFLLAFVLTPLVMAVQRWGLPRLPAVLFVVLSALVIFGVVGWGVGTQVTKLADDLPAHAGEVKAKILRLRSSGAGPFSRAIDAVEGISDAWKKTPAPGASPDRQLVVDQASASPFERLLAIASAVIEPIADAGLVLILVIFMLVKREDLRNRVIGLLGHGRLTGATRVFVESAERISRLLLMQLCINSAFGIIFGALLWIFGVPYWFLWGSLTVVLRFIPYVGAWLAAALPVLLSFAVSPGWVHPILVLAVFILLDLTTANVVEPLLFGHSTGVTPVALLIAAVFWTWVWGPLGLVLSTPLTVCLVVLGQHVPRLRFLSLLLGDQPALEPHLAYYQRLLAGDRNEALLVAEKYRLINGSDRLPDDVVVPALRLARRDRNHAGLTVEDESFIFESTEKLIDKLQTLPSPQSNEADSIPQVLGCAAHHRAEELTLQLLSNLLKPACCMTVVSTRTLPVEIENKVETERPALVFIAILPPGGISQARHLCHRLRTRFPSLKIVVGYFGPVKNFDRLLVRLRAAGASYVTTSVLQARQQIMALLAAAHPVPPTSTSPNIDPPVDFLATVLPGSL
jgi:predicted PurR-regulated permease PerM